MTRSDAWQMGRVCGRTPGFRQDFGSVVWARTGSPVLSHIHPNTGASGHSAARLHGGSLSYSRRSRSAGGIRRMGQGANREMLWATLPKDISAIEPLPWVPKTIMEISAVLRTSRMTGTGCPTTIRVWTWGTPAASSRPCSRSRKFRATAAASTEDGVRRISPAWP